MQNSRFTLLVLFFCAGLSFAGAQTGRLYMTLYRQNFSYDDSIRYAITTSDQVIRKGSFGENDYLRVDSVPEGIYEVNVTVNGVPNVVYHDVKIEQGKTTSIDVLTTDQQFQESRFDSVQDYFVETALFGMYGPSSQPMPLGSPLKDSYRFGFSAGYFNDLSRFYAPGLTLGSNMAFTRFKKGMSLDSTAHAHERYFAWNVSAAFINRFTFYDYRTVDNTGAILDIGVEYNCPLLFRHTEVDGSVKRFERNIHQFTDLSVLVRFGYSTVVIQAEYRVLDFLVGNYPEVPPFRIGLSLLLPTEND